MDLKKIILLLKQWEIIIIKIKILIINKMKEYPPPLVYEKN